MRGSNDLVGVGQNTRHTPDHRLQMRRALEIVIGDDELGALPELLQSLRGEFGRFNFYVDRLSAGVGRGLEDPYLVFDSAVEPAVILVAPARGEYAATGM